MTPMYILPYFYDEYLILIVLCVFKAYNFFFHMDMNENDFISSNKIIVYSQKIMTYYFGRQGNLDTQLCPY